MHNTIFFQTTDIFLGQEQLWNETIRYDSAAETEAHAGGHALQELNPQMMYEVHVANSRLVYKAGQLIHNFTTNLAEKLDTCALQI